MRGWKGRFLKETLKVSYENESMAIEYSFYYIFLGFWKIDSSKIGEKDGVGTRRFWMIWKYFLGGVWWAFCLVYNFKLCSPKFILSGLYKCDEGWVKLAKCLIICTASYIAVDSLASQSFLKAERTPKWIQMEFIQSDTKANKNL